MAAAATPTLEEQTRDLGQRLAKYYGPRVTVEYVDVFSPQMMEHPDALRVLTRRNVPLPLVSVDGKPTFAGGISIDMITEELEKLGLVSLQSSGGD